MSVNKKCSDKLFNMYASLNEHEYQFSVLKKTLVVKKDLSIMNRLYFVQYLDSFEMLLCEIDEYKNFLNEDQLQDMMSVIRKSRKYIDSINKVLKNIEFDIMSDVVNFFADGDHDSDLPF